MVNVIMEISCVFQRFNNVLVEWQAFGTWYDSGMVLHLISE